MESVADIPWCEVDPLHEVIRYGSHNGKPRFYCKECKKKFKGDGSYSGGKFPRQRITETLTHYYNGQSFGNIQQTFMDLYRERISKETLWHWLLRYTLISSFYVDTLTPDLGDEWVADETAIHIDGEIWWFWDIIDKKTRYLIASHLSKTRGIAKAKKLMEMAAQLGTPSAIMTDKLHDYKKSIRDVFGSDVHFTSAGFGSPTNIQMIERFHGTVKQRTKVMRHFKTGISASVILEGFGIYYNLLKQHEALGFDTPAIVAGVGIGVNSWGDLIKHGKDVLALDDSEEEDDVTDYAIANPPGEDFADDFDYNPGNIDAEDWEE